MLFYSELPNGEADPKSLHGGCPVLDGVKVSMREKMMERVFLKSKVLFLCSMRQIFGFGTPLDKATLEAPRIRDIKANPR